MASSNCPQWFASVQGKEFVYSLF